MDTTKEGIKAYLDEIATKRQGDWAEQETHKLAVCAFFCDMLGIEDKAERNKVRDQWMATPSPFGCNASAMAQKIDPTRKNKTEKVFSQFDL